MSDKSDNWKCRTCGAMFEHTKDRRLEDGVTQCSRCVEVEVLHNEIQRLKGEPMARNQNGCASGEKKVTKCCDQGCTKMDLLIRVPHEIKNEFLSLLDIAQSQFTEEDVVHFTMEEKKVMAWVRNVLLDGKASKQFTTGAEKEKASQDMARMFSTNNW